MKNLKKLLAVIVSVCVLATFAFPAFAAEKTAAEICEELGVLKGDSSLGVTDEYLAKGTTRDQAAILYLRLIGKEDEAYAFEGEDNFADADLTWDNAKKALAYLKANPDLGWQGVSADKFDPKAPISAQQMYKVCLEALGYKQGVDFEWAEVFTFAAEKGLTLIADVTEMTNNDVATALVEALKLPLKGSETTLIEDLVAKGVVTEAAAIAAGLIEPAPEELEVVDVTATNLIQAVVTFNQKVDKDTANDKDNYSFATSDKITIDNASLQDDGVSVVLTFTAAVGQQKEATLTVKGVKTVAGEAMEKTSKKVSFLDSTIPAVVSAEVAGISTIKVTFSEPMQFGVSGETASDWTKYFKVNDGKYYVKNVRNQKNNTEFLVELYTSLKDGDLPFEVKVGPKDWAGFTAMGYSTTLKVVEDKEAPVVVSYKDAKPHSVVLIWSEDIELVNGATANYYHTNSNNQIANTLTSAEIDGNEMTLKFADAKKLPNGTAYVYVLKDAVKDLWNNKNAQQMVKLDIVADNDPPVLQSIEFKDEQKIELLFDEDVKASTATKKANYTLLDKDGKEVKNIFSSFSVNGKKVTVNFTKKLEGGDYTLVVKDIEDIAGNAMSSASMSFTVTDKTAPVASEFSAKLYIRGTAPNDDQVIKVSFGQEMAVGGTYGIDDLSKYVLKTGNKRIEKIDDVTIAVVDDGKAVEIVIPKAKYTIPATDIYNAGPPATNLGGLIIARVADAAGNYTEALTNAVDLKPSGTIGIEKAELTGAKEIKVYFTDTLAKFEDSEIIFTGAAASGSNDVASVTTDTVDGKTVATYTFTDELPYDATGLNVTTNTAAKVTVNGYDEPLANSLSVPVDDKLAPALAKKTIGADDVDDVSISIAPGVSDPAKYINTVTLTFNENLSSNYLSYGSFEVAGFDVNTITLSSGNKVVITLKESEDRVDIDTAVTMKIPVRDASVNFNALDELDTAVKYSQDALDVQAEAAGIPLTFSASGSANDTVMPSVTSGYSISVKTTSDATKYDATGKILADGTVNVVYTVTHIASGMSADTGTVVVTVTIS